MKDKNYGRSKNTTLNTKPSEFAKQDYQPNEELVKRITTALEQVASISDKYKAVVDRLTDEKVLSTREEINVEKNIVEKKETSDIRHQSNNISYDTALKAVNENLTQLLHGQQLIGARLDGMKEEQEENKRQLEGGLKNVIDELKTEMAGKSFEQSEELNKLRLKQEHLYEDFNLLNVRLDEMELLVSKLMQQTEPQEVLIRMPEIKKPATIVEIADDDEGSLHSVLSISSGSLAEEPTGLVKKTRKPSQAFLYSQSAGGPFRKDSKQDPVEIIRF